MTIEFTKTTAIEAAITDALDAEIATRWVVVAETVDSDGEVSLVLSVGPQGLACEGVGFPAEHPGAHPHGQAGAAQAGE